MLTFCLTRSRDWTCPECKCANKELLAPLSEESKEATTSPEQMEPSKPIMETPTPSPQIIPVISQEKENVQAEPQSRPQQQSHSQTSQPQPLPNSQVNTNAEPVVMHHVEGLQGNRMIVTRAQASRPPFLLDAAIATLMVLVGALLVRKIF
jgi:hypothetical protein